MTNHLHGGLGRLPGPGGLGSLARLLATRSCALLLTVLLGACATTVAPPQDPSVSKLPPVAAAAASAAASAAAPVASASEPAAETAAAAPTPLDPLRPDVHVDIDDRSAQIDLWERVRRGFAMPDLDNERVHDREQWYATRPDYVERMTTRGSRYLFHIVEELERRGMPTELALLPFIESAFNPQAMSSARASGMWQFIPSTGKDYDLKQNLFRDDRRDVLASTRAALDYLQRLYGMFGDWHLALAAYNWGEGSVTRAIARNQKLGLPTDYANLKMPNETAYYVPKLQAVKNIVSRPADFGLKLPELRNHPYFLTVPIERDMDVSVAVKLAGIPVDEFQTLNPQMNRPVILAAGTPQILLPYDNANQFVRQLPLHRGPLATWTAWSVPKTMRPADAARQVGMDEETLREVNRIPPRMLVRAGSTLLVPRGDRRHADVPVEVADNAVMALAPDAPPPRRLQHKAGRKETVASVARRYHVSPAQVAQWNGVGRDATFAPGHSVVVFVPGKAVRSAKSTAKATRYAGASQGAVHKAGHKASAGKRVAAAQAPSGARKGGSAGKATRVGANGRVRVAHN